MEPLFLCVKAVDLILLSFGAGASCFMRGVINLRGSVAPVIDLRLKFMVSATEKTVSACVISLR